MSAIISKDYSHLLPPEHQQHFRLMVTSLPSNMYEGATQHQAYLQTPKGFVAGSRNAVTHPEKRGLIMNYYTSHGAQRPMGGEFNLGDEAHLAPHAAHPMMQAVVERALREHLAGQGVDPAAQQLGGNWNDADKLFGRPYSHLGSLQEQLSGVKKLNGGGETTPPVTGHLKVVKSESLEKNVDDKDKQKLAPPQWLGRPIVDHGHVQDLETRAAMNEFGHKMPRHQAEQVAHDSYVQEQRERAAAHHLAGMKAAMATGNHEDAKKHWALYDMHLKSLGKESIGAVPPEIEKRMMEETGEKPLYRFKAHKGDLYALHAPSKDQAPPQGVPIQKAENRQEQRVRVRKEITSCIKAGKHNKEFVGGSSMCSNCGWSDKLTGMPVHDAHEGGGQTSEPKTGHLKVVKVESFEKAEAKQCKWKLGERRCKRMVTTDYCHDHVDHWANKIRQREEAETPMEKAALPPAGTGQLASPPAPAAPQLHNTVEGFVGGLKALPKGSPERGKYLTAHMSHAPFISALSQHPQGKQVHAMIMQHLNSPANAGFKPGATKVVAKTETLQTAKELLKAIAELAKGKLLEFPGNPAPAVDQGQPAQVQSIVPPLAECPRCIAAAHNVLQGGAKLEDAIGPQSAAIFRKKHALADPSPYRQGAQNQRIETHRSLTALIHARHDFKKK
jgi:hypothetical protein